MASYACRICGRETAYEDRVPELYPFCSARCQRVDLGYWLMGRYAIDRDVTPDDLESLPDADRDG